MRMPEHRIMSLQSSLEELAELGSPVDLSIVKTQSEHLGLEIEQANGVHDSRIFQLENGRVGYMLDLVITNQTSRPIYVIDRELRTPWEDDLFDWLTPQERTIQYRSRKPDKSYELYRFTGRNGLELPANEVINEALTEGKCLSPRRPIRGWLLAMGGTMPVTLQQGQWTDVNLVITASDHVEHTKKIRLWTERLEVRPKLVRRSSSLYDDPIRGAVIAGNASPAAKPIPEPAFLSARTKRQAQNLEEAT